MFFLHKKWPCFFKAHFGNSSSNVLVLEFRPLQIAWVNSEFYAEVFCELILMQNILRDLTRFQCLVMARSGSRFTLSPIIMVQWKPKLNKRKLIFP